MRLNRAVSLLMATILMAAALSQALVSPSQASSGEAAAAERAGTKVSINFAGGTKSFRLYGKITPRANHKTATLLRASRANGHYAKFRTTRTNKQGKYAFTGLKKEGFYRVRVGNATSKVIHVCKGGCG